MKHKDPADLVWPSYFKQYFYPLEGDDLAVWQAELERIWNIAESDVIRAIRAMAEDRKCPKYPKLNNLTYHIRQIMNADTQADAVPAEACGLCSGIGLLIGFNRPEKGYRAGTYSVPCLCSLGKQKAWAWAKSDPKSDSRQSFDRLQNIARRVKAEMEAGYVVGLPLPEKGGRREHKAAEIY